MTAVHPITPYSTAFEDSVDVLALALDDARQNPSDFDLWKEVCKKLRWAKLDYFDVQTWFGHYRGSVARLRRLAASAAALAEKHAHRFSGHPDLQNLLNSLRDHRDELAAR